MYKAPKLNNNNDNIFQNTQNSFNNMKNTQNSFNNMKNTQNSFKPEPDFYK